MGVAAADFEKWALDIQKLVERGTKGSLSVYIVSGKF